MSHLCVAEFVSGCNKHFPWCCALLFFLGFAQCCSLLVFHLAIGVFPPYFSLSWCEHTKSHSTSMNNPFNLYPFVSKMDLLLALVFITFSSTLTHSLNHVSTFVSSHSPTIHDIHTHKYKHVFNGF